MGGHSQNLNRTFLVQKHEKCLIVKEEGNECAGEGGRALYLWDALLFMVSVSMVGGLEQIPHE